MCVPQSDMTWENYSKMFVKNLVYAQLHKNYGKMTGNRELGCFRIPH